MEIETIQKIMEASIKAEFPTVEIINIQHNNNHSKYAFKGISIDDCYENDTFNNIKLIARQDAFFAKVHSIKRMIESAGFNVDLIKKPVSENNKIAKSYIQINFY